MAKGGVFDIFGDSLRVARLSDTDHALAMLVQIDKCVWQFEGL
jgi:hypothetical protein